MNKYYDLATSFYEYGWGESFHFAHRYKWETLRESIVRHEHFLASKLNVKPGDKGTYLHFPNPNTVCPDPTTVCPYTTDTFLLQSKSWTLGAAWAGRCGRSPRSRAPR